MPRFEKYVPRNSQSVTHPYVSILRKGVFTLNKAAYEQLGAPARVELLWSADEQTIGFQTAPPESMGGLLVTAVTPAAETYQVAGRGFLARHHIARDRTRRYLARMEDGLLLVDLRQVPEITDRGGAPDAVEGVAP